MRIDEVLGLAKLLVKQDRLRKASVKATFAQMEDPIKAVKYLIKQGDKIKKNHIPKDVADKLLLPSNRPAIVSTKKSTHNTPSSETRAELIARLTAIKAARNK
jgi:hypothetical protein